jgi:hypothetical protein
LAQHLAAILAEHRLEVVATEQDLVVVVREQLEIAQIFYMLVEQEELE